MPDRCRRRFARSTSAEKSCAAAAAAAAVLRASFLPLSVLAYYSVDVFRVLPRLCRPPSVAYAAHVLPLTFVVFNALANYYAAVVRAADSSAAVGRPQQQQQQQQPQQRLAPSGRASKDFKIMYCDTCQCVMPPRCWHCDVCGVCILTRDHHCTFSSTCVGHYNRRYFLLFLFYFSVASFYEIILISYYAYNEVTIQFSDLMVLVPIQLIVSGFRITLGQIFVLLLTLNLIAVTMSTLLLIFHLNKVRKGLVCHEKQDSNYDFGLRRNLETVFGEKWYITWISPFIKSKLPYNGTDWHSHITQCKTD